MGGSAEQSEQAGVEAGDKLFAESKDVALDTLDELYRQRGQLESIDEDVDRLEDNLKRADKLLKQFSKRMAADKFIQCFGLVNALLFCILVIYFFVANPDTDVVVPPPKPY